MSDWESFAASRDSETAPLVDPSGGRPEPFTTPLTSSPNSNARTHPSTATLGSPAMTAGMSRDGGSETGFGVNGNSNNNNNNNNKTGVPNQPADYIGLPSLDSDGGDDSNSALPSEVLNALNKAPERVRAGLKAARGQGNRNELTKLSHLVWSMKGRSLLSTPGVQALGGAIGIGLLVMWFKGVTWIGGLSGVGLGGLSAVIGAVVMIQGSMSDHATSARLTATGVTFGYPGDLYKLRAIRTRHVSPSALVEPPFWWMESPTPLPLTASWLRMHQALYVMFCRSGPPDEGATMAERQAVARQFALRRRMAAEKVEAEAEASEKTGVLWMVWPIREQGRASYVLVRAGSTMSDEEVSYTGQELLTVLRRVPGLSFDVGSIGGLGLVRGSSWTGRPKTGALAGHTWMGGPRGLFGASLIGVGLVCAVGGLLGFGGVSAAVAGFKLFG